MREAEEKFLKLGLHTISTLHADGGLGWKAQAPFDRIIVTAAAQDVPPVLVDQLAVGGIMVVTGGGSIPYAVVVAGVADTKRC